MELEKYDHLSAYPITQVGEGTRLWLVTTCVVIECTRVVLRGAGGYRLPSHGRLRRSDVEGASKRRVVMVGSRTCTIATS